MNDRGVVVVVGSPSAVLGAGGAYEAVGLGVRVATELVRDRKSTRLNSSHSQQSRMPSSA